MRRPTGVTAIAVVFFLIAAYLGGIGVVVLVSPGTVSSTFGTDSLSFSLVAGLGRPGDFCARGDGVVSIQDAYR